MSPLFGDKHKKAEHQAAAQGALDRLLGLPVLALAAEILPAFNPGAVSGSGGRVNALLAANFLTKQGPRASGNVRSLLGAAQEGLQALEHAGLITQAGSNSGASPSYTITRLGQTALTEGSARRYLS
jgi:hypothetical protein